MIEQAIVFMVAVSLPLMLVVEQLTCWRSGLARSDEPRGHEGHGVAPALPPRSRAGAMFYSTEVTYGVGLQRGQRRSPATPWSSASLWRPGRSHDTLGA